MKKRRRIRTARLVKYERPCDCPLCATVQRLVIEMAWRVIAAPTKKELLGLLAQTSTVDGVLEFFRRLQSEVPPGIARAVQRERRRSAAWQKEIATLPNKVRRGARRAIHRGKRATR